MFVCKQLVQQETGVHRLNYQADHLMCSGMNIDQRASFVVDLTVAPRLDISHWRGSQREGYSKNKHHAMSVSFLGFQKQSLIETWLSRENH